MARFQNYAEFVQDYFNHLSFDDARYFYVQKLNIAGQQVALLGLNSAWLCASDKDKTEGLIIGERQTRIALEQTEDVDVRIALLHHPFDWLREFDQNDSAAMLLDNCDFILHGHSHRSATTQLTSPDSAAMIVACGACYETRDFPNMYNWVQLDLTAGTGTVYLRRYADARGGFWAKDTLTYRNVPDGVYSFELCDRLIKKNLDIPPQAVQAAMTQPESHTTTNADVSQSILDIYEVHTSIIATQGAKSSEQLPTQPDRLAYHHEKFVDRNQEIETVLDIVQRLLQEEETSRRTILLQGQRGSGKSWLLQEIAYRLEDNADMLCLSLDLSDYAKQAPQEAVWSIMQRIHHVLFPDRAFEAHRLATAHQSQRAEWLVNQVRRNNVPLVLLLDYVDESDEALLETLENYVLGPLSGEPTTLLILAGRGRQHLWKRPELRIKSIYINLEPFELQHTQSQLSKQVPEAVTNAEQVQALSGGYPWSNYILSRQWPDLVSALDESINLLLGEHQDLRPYFEALCVLRAFDEARMAPLFKAYREELTKEEWNYVACREMRKAMLDTGMVKWKENENGYTIDQALRLMLKSYLRLHDSKRWRSLHQTAIKLFTAWADTYERTRERWQDEAEYHKKCLNLSNHTPADER